MVIITMKNITSKIDGLTDILINLINSKLSYVTTSFGAKPIVNTLFNSNKCTTYTGVIPYIVNTLIQFKIPYEIIDLRQKPEKNANFKINPNYIPRDYQANIIDKVSSRKVIQAATGAGL